MANLFCAISQEILCWRAGLATSPLSNSGIRDSIEVLHPAVKLGRDGTPSKNKILPHSAGLEQAEGVSFRRANMPCSFPASSFSVFQFPASSYCVSWCISPHIFCSIKEGPPGVLLVEKMFPQEVICCIIFTGQKQKKQTIKKLAPGICNCQKAWVSTVCLNEHSQENRGDQQRNLLVWNWQESKATTNWFLWTN